MQRKKKRSIIFELHSIPIKIRSLWTNTRKNIRNSSLRISNSKRLYLVSYSIPLSCMVALLLVGMVCVGTLSNYNKVSATDQSNNNISRASSIGTSSANLSVSGDAQNKVVDASVGVVAYRKHFVTVDVQDVNDYQLFISGENDLTPPVGGLAVPGITVADGVVGSELAEGTWGYAWEVDDPTASDDALKYKGLGSGRTLLSGPTLQDNNARFTAKLNFAANFSASAALGNYTSSVTLSLIATPRSTASHAFWRNENGAETNIDSGVGTMQEVTPAFCRSDSKIQEGWTVDLVDARGETEAEYKTYTIVKLRDGNCWMQENLALTATNTDGLVLSSGDTDLTEGTIWVLPETQSKTATSWTGDNKVAMSRVGAEEYGNYYTWCAATAGSCELAASSDMVAPSSICPKGWKLPTGKTGGQFYTLFGASGSNLGSSYQAKFDAIQSEPYKFSPAGSIGSNGVLSGSGFGTYWSSMSAGTVELGGAFKLAFGKSLFESGIDGTGARWYGNSARCVLDTTGTWETPSGEKVDSGLHYMQDVTKSNFADKYCALSQNSLIPVESTITLQDKRDGNYYKIVKLKDGNCWMQQNLRLIATSDDGLTLNPSDTNISKAWIMPKTLVGSGTTISEWANDNVNPYSATFNNATYGTYYNWCAATAGTCSEAKTAGTVVSGSVCPNGWHLPSGSTNGEFYALMNGLNMFVVTILPYLFPAAGSVASGVLSSAGSNGSYWSSVSSSETQAYRLRFANSSFYPGTDGVDNLFGFSVRCVADY